MLRRTPHVREYHLPSLEHFLSARGRRLDNLNGIVIIFQRLLNPVPNVRSESVSPRMIDRSCLLVSEMLFQTVSVPELEYR